MDRTAELAAANQELETFTYSVAHDLRAPLRQIHGLSQIVEEDFASQMPAKALEYLKKIGQRGKDMGQMVDDLLKLSRIVKQDFSRQWIGLRSLVDEAVAGIMLETEGRQIEWRISDLPSVACDPGLMRQVFSNLLSNAVKYTRPRDKALVEVGQVKVNDELAIFVRDNGVGFNMEYVDKLFGVFQRLHGAEDFEGTGVGLAIVARVIHKHGGRIWAEGKVDKGATFYFTLEQGGKI